MKAVGPLVSVGASVAGIIKAATGTKFGAGDVIFLLSVIIVWSLAAWYWSAKVKGPRQ